MNVEKNQITQSDDNMCKNCKAFYASDSFDGLCSGCFKYFFHYLEKTIETKKKNSKLKKLSLSLKKPSQSKVKSQLKKKIPSKSQFKKTERDASIVAKKLVSWALSASVV